MSHAEKKDGTLYCGEMSGGIYSIGFIVIRQTHLQQHAAKIDTLFLFGYKFAEWRREHPPHFDEKLHVVFISQKFLSHMNNMECCRLYLCNRVVVKG